jgi:hypothetical protein
MPSDLGTIRMGESLEQDGKDWRKPTTAETWLITSNNQRALAELASAVDEKGNPIYGGEIEPYEGNQTKEKWRLRTEVRDLPVIVPPVGSDAFSLQYEIWNNQKAMVRKCDGMTFQSREDGKSPWNEPKACICQNGGKECRLKTRIKLLLAHGPLGSWNFRTGNEHQGFRLVGSMQACQQMAVAGIMPRAILTVEWTTSSTGKYPDPIINPVMGIEQFEKATALEAERMEALGSGQFDPRNGGIAAGPAVNQLGSGIEVDPLS